MSVAFSSYGKTLAAEYGLRASGVVLWDVAGRKRVIQAPLPVKGGRVASVAFSPDSKTLAAGYVRSSGASVALWDVAERKLVVEESLPVTYGSVTSLAFSPDCKTLAAGYGYVRGLHTGGGVLLWDVAGRTGGS